MIRLTIRPPAIIHVRAKGAADKWGKTRGPFVSLPHGYPEHQFHHELHHVKQWWAVTLGSAAAFLAASYLAPAVPVASAWLSVGVFGALMFASKRFRLLAEVAAYAVSVKYAPQQAMRFGKALSLSYGLGVNSYDYRSLIVRKSQKGGLF